MKEFNREIASMIDHTVLKPQAQENDIIKLCEEAQEYGFATVCVNPYYVPLAKKLLLGSSVGITTVIGFPLGASTKETKAFEAKDAIEKGATEVDMVMNIGALKDQKFNVVLEDIIAVVEASGVIPVKVIIETCLLTDEEKVKACELSKEAGAAFVKTSTGFSTGGAAPEDIGLMRRTVGPEMGVKASGGVRNLAGARAVIEKGATRIGASASIAIVTGGTSESQY